MTVPVEGLVRLGLTEYEARAYVAMVSLGEGGINDISQASGLPRSRVYDIMEKLALKGFVEIGAVKPLRYRAVDPDQVTKQIRNDLNRTAETVNNSLKELKKTTEKHSTPLWFILGEKRIETETREFISKAKEPLEILVLSNGLLVRHAAQLAERSKNLAIDVVVDIEPDNFKGLLGSSRLLSMPDLRTTSLDWMVGIGFPFEDFDRMVKFELVMISGNNSLLVYKEGETRRAMVVEGSIIGLFIRTCVDGVVQNGEEL